MLMLISPAKTLEFETPAPSKMQSKPLFLNRAEVLIKLLREFNANELQAMMNVSEKIVRLNADRVHAWRKTQSLQTGKQAIFAFKGDVYAGLDAASLDATGQARAQDRLRILSGLYGYLRPMDIIMPYRLEMGTQLQNTEGPNLYQYWRDLVTTALNDELSRDSDPWVLNLASQEYFKAVNSHELKGPVVSPEFKDFKNGKFKVISFFAKKARGMMARYCLDKDITRTDQISAFNLDGYYYASDQSSEFKPVFLRD